MGSNVIIAWDGDPTATAAAAAGVQDGAKMISSIKQMISRTIMPPALN